MIRNRLDEKWAHPEAYETGAYRLEQMNTREGVPLHEQLRAGRSANEEEFEVDLVGGGWLADYTIKDYLVEKGCPEDPSAPPVKVKVCYPPNMEQFGEEGAPVLFVVPGGGLVSGGTAADLMCTYLIMHDPNMVLVLSGYRLSPENPYPAPLNDVHACYQWMIENAGELGIDTDRIVFNGESAGGYMALSLAFRLMRYNWCGAPMPRGILIGHPQMDDVADTMSNTFVMVDEDGLHRNWDAYSSYEAAKAYLGDHVGDPFLSPEACPNRAKVEDVRGFPPTWFVNIPEFDCGRDSVIKFAQTLLQADVFCDIHVWGGGNHGLMPLPVREDEPLALCNRLRDSYSGALRDAVMYDFRRQWLWE